MNTAAPTQRVEQFHLLFLAQLARRVAPALFVVKGGCNLRFFHKSVRYSEGMDLDLGKIGVTALKDHVRGIFASAPFGQMLRARGLTLDRVTEPKQTDTTQRWKIGLRADGLAAPLPTKIECSRRGLDDGVAFGSVDAGLARLYQLPPLMVSHYTAQAALGQKIGALAGRPETQARDVFDVHHLLTAGAILATAQAPDPHVIRQAAANAMTIDFADFKSQVLAYLDPEEQIRFRSPVVWDAMVLEVVDALGRVAP